MKKAFTLLEVLIVIIIIAILATFAIPRYLKAARRAIASEAVTTIGAIRGALARYYQEWNTLPSSLDELDIDNPNLVPNAKFTYSFSGASLDDYSVTALGQGRAEGITVIYDATTNSIDITYP